MQPWQEVLKYVKFYLKITLKKIQEKFVDELHFMQLLAWVEKVTFTEKKTRMISKTLNQNLKILRKYNNELRWFLVKGLLYLHV